MSEQKVNNISECLLFGHVDTSNFFFPLLFCIFHKQSHTSRMRERSEHLLWWLCVGVCRCWFNKCWMLSFAFVFHDHQKHFELPRAHFNFFCVVATSSFKFEFFTLTIFVSKCITLLHVWWKFLKTIFAFFLCCFLRVKLCDLATRFIGMCFAYFCKSLVYI